MIGKALVCAVAILCNSTANVQTRMDQIDLIVSPIDFDNKAAFREFGAIESVSILYDAIDYAIGITISDLSQSNPVKKGLMREHSDFGAENTTTPYMLGKNMTFNICVFPLGDREDVGVSNCSISWSLPLVSPWNLEFGHYVAALPEHVPFYRLLANIRPQLTLRGVFSNIDSVPRRSSGLPSFPEGQEEQGGANTDYHCRPEGVLGHPLGGIIHRLCGEVHALLGSKIAYLPLLGFILAALAGIGGGIAFDDLNRQRNRKYLGLALLFGGGPLGLFILLLSLP
jgi:hypothetical protein